MGKLEGIFRSEIARLSKREMRKVTLPIARDVRSLKTAISPLRKTVAALERLAARLESERRSEKTHLAAAPEEVKASRFSPRLIRALRQRLGVTQRDLALLTGVTVGAVYQWEKGISDPRDDKKAALVALRKMGRRDVRRLLQEKGPSKNPSKVKRPRKLKRRRSRKK